MPCIYDDVFDWSIDWNTILMETEKAIETVETKQYFNALVSEMGRFQCNDRFSDVDVEVDGKVFKCHRLILSSASEYFNIMFRGNFQESSATKLTLREIEADVFAEVLNFIYTGEAVISTSNVYNVIRAADFYRISLLVELCTKFIQKNLNEVAEDCLKVYSFAYYMGFKDLVKILARHIKDKFGYCAVTPEFVLLSFNNLTEILNEAAREQIDTIKDPFMQCFYSWLSYGCTVTPLERYYLSDSNWSTTPQLTECFAKIAHYSRSGFMEIPKSSENNDDNNVIFNNHLQFTNFLRAYISRTDKNGYSIGTNIFTGFSYSDTHLTWVYSGELECPSDYLKSVVIDNCLIYSLTYSKKRPGHDPQQTFSCSSSISMCSYSSLTPPPYILDDYDMCGRGNEIYVYNRNAPEFLRQKIQSSKNNTFSQDECLRGLFVYKRDIGSWFPLPQPKFRSRNACMTCDNERLYLIGGSNLNNCVQAYDFCTQEWSVLCHTVNRYRGGACCVFEKKIYIVGSTNSPKVGEVYDPLLGYWQPFKHDFLCSKRCKINRKLAPWLRQSPNRSIVVTYPQTLTGDSRIYSLNSSVPRCSRLLPNLYASMKNTHLKFTNLQILDMISF